MLSRLAWVKSLTPVWKLAAWARYLPVTICGRSFSFSSQYISKMSLSETRLYSIFTVNGLCVVFRIVPGDFGVQMAEITPVKALSHAHAFASRMAHAVDRSFLVETARIDHKDVALPSPDRIGQGRGELEGSGNLRPSAKTWRCRLSTSQRSIVTVGA